MADLQFERVAPEGFEWDQEKSKTNLAKHGIAFEEASEIFYGPVIVVGSNRNDEERWLAVGSSHDRIISVIFTLREGFVRIISARHPRSNEERAYRHAQMGRPAEGQD